MTVTVELREFAPPEFHLVRLLGRGASGVVWEATQASTGRAVALKLLDVDPERGDGDRRRFDRERQVMGALGAHPHIVTIFDAGACGGRPWIAMELCRRGSLDDRLRADGPLTAAQAVRVLVAMSAALGTVHDQGVLHCDVKPANILVTDFGEPALSDFGIARHAAGFSTTTVGYTVDHVPPEVLDDGRHGVATDVYSLGTTVWHLLAGRPPFRTGGDTSVATVMRRILLEPLPDLDVPDAPADLVELIGRMASKSPQERPQSMHEVHEQAREILGRLGGPGGSTFEAGPPPAAPLTAPPEAPLADPATPYGEAVPTPLRADGLRPGMPQLDDVATRLRAQAVGVQTGTGGARRRPMVLLGTGAAAALAVGAAVLWGVGAIGPAPEIDRQANVVADAAPSGVAAGGPTAVAPPADQQAIVVAPPVPAPGQAAPRVAAPVPFTPAGPPPVSTVPGGQVTGPSPSPEPPQPPPVPRHATVTVSTRVPTSSAGGGTDTGVPLKPGQALTLSASGSAGYGYDVDCANGAGVTDPNGARTVGGQPCEPKYDPNMPLPSAPVGALIAHIGVGRWFLVGSSWSGPAIHSGDLWLAHNDSYAEDNTGSYAVQITVTG